MGKVSPPRIVWLRYLFDQRNTLRRAIQRDSYRLVKRQMCDIVYSREILCAIFCEKEKNIVKGQPLEKNHRRKSLCRMGS